MTTIKDKLEKFYGNLKEVEALRHQIEDLYKISAYDFQQKISTNEVSNPTERNAMKIVELRGKLERRIASLISNFDEVEDFVESIDDGELRAILRFHYLTGLSWTETNRKVFGYNSSSTAYMRADRYFDKIEKNSSVDNVNEQE